MEGPESTDITLRLMNYFQRQTAWLEKLQGELEQMSASLELEHLDELVSTSHSWEKGNQAFAEEFNVLKKEWDCTSGIRAEDRNAVQVMARDVESRVNSMQTLFKKSAELAGEKSLILKAELDKLHIGRGMLGKYKTPSSPDSDNFDSSI